MYGRMTGHRLNPSGEAQACRVGAHLAVNHPKIGAVVCSPMLRAHATAFEISKLLPTFITARRCGQTPVIKVDDRLDEVITPHEGAPLRAMEKIEFDIYNPAHQQVVDEMTHETFEEVAQRAVEGIKAIGRAAIRSGHDEILIVSHGDPIQAMRLWGMGQELTTANRDRITRDDGASLIPGVPYPTHCSLTTIEMGFNTAVRGCDFNDVFCVDPEFDTNDLPMYWLNNSQKREAFNRQNPYNVIRPL